MSLTVTVTPSELPSFRVNSDKKDSGIWEDLREGPALLLYLHKRKNYSKKRGHPSSKITTCDTQVLLASVTDSSKNSISEKHATVIK